MFEPRWVQRKALGCAAVVLSAVVMSLDDVEVSPGIGECRGLIDLCPIGEKGGDGGVMFRRSTRPHSLTALPQVKDARAVSKSC